MKVKGCFKTFGDGRREEFKWSPFFGMGNNRDASKLKEKSLYFDGGKMGELAQRFTPLKPLEVYHLNHILHPSGAEGIPGRPCMQRI